MSAAATTPAPAARALAALADSHPQLPGGTAWAQYRANALSRLTAAGLPTPRDDGFKYANLRILERRDLRPQAPAAASTFAPAGDRLVVPDAHSILIVDGIVDARAADATDLPGVTIERVAQAPMTGCGYGLPPASTTASSSAWRRARWSASRSTSRTSRRAAAATRAWSWNWGQARN